MRSLQAFALAAALAAGACASNDVQMPEVGARTAPAEVAIEASSSNWSDVNVYAAVSGSYIRLGTVPSSGSARLQLPRSIANTTHLRLLLDPIGGTHSFTTDEIPVNGGTEVQLQIENELPLSHWTIR